MSDSLVFIDHISNQRVCGMCHTLPHLFNWPTLSNWSNYSTRLELESIPCVVLWQSCSLINGSFNAISICYDSTKKKGRQRIRVQANERDRNRGEWALSVNALFCVVLFNLSDYKPELSHILHSLFFIFHNIYQS